MAAPKHPGSLIARVAVLAVLLAWCPAAVAQHRPSSKLTSGGLRISSPVESLNRRSPGIGGVGAPAAPGAGSGVLRSAARFGAPGMPGQAVPGGAFAGGARGGASPALNPGRSRMHYRVEEPKTNFGVGGISRGLSKLTSPEGLAGLALLKSFGTKDAAVLTDSNAAITSFVPATIDPEAENRYVELLIAGERSMQNRRYQDAADAFVQARYIAARAPESLLSLAHAHLGTGNYRMMATCIRLAIAEFPELPLVQIELRRFYQSAAEFVSLRQQLRQELTAAAQAAEPAPADPALLLALAYVEWFDGNADDARGYLLEAARHSTDPLLSDGIEAFWEGMARTGRADGRLVEQAGLVTGPAQPPPVPAPDAPPEGRMPS